MKRLLLIGLLVLLLISLKYFWIMTANAQGETTVSVSPSESNMYLNGDNTQEINLLITNAVEIVGFDVVVTYNEMLMTLNEWSIGDFLSSPFCYVPVNDPGYIQIACTQLNMETASGSGVLFNLNFAGNSPGSSTLELIKAEMTNLESHLIQAQKVNATITVGYAASAVLGNFLLQGQSDRAGIPISLSNGVTFGQGPYEVLSVHDLCQNLVFPSVVNNDSYTITTSQPRYLNLEATLAKTVTVPPSANVTLPPLRLLAGDVVADNMINTADLDAIRDAFGTLGEGIGGDVNFDGVVDLRDLALAGGNFGLSAAEAYGGWLP